jgi:MobA/MobL family
MVLHARPHLETHTRSAGHSAVAGVAYRLGLRLYDRRAGVWHDFRRRQVGEEIVRALTVAPDGAPAWATDPDELWNRVEQAEKRKDAQLARDYRIPVPFGLTDDQAGALAEDMARFICRELNTAVSMGLHRDADIDALGNEKPETKIGFHAHLYFPTRRLEEINGEEGTGDGEWGLGAKLVLLSNKNTSGSFVERLNERWAELANRYTSAHQLPADYTHLSYARQELPVTPQPTLGAAVVAMERRGFFTRRGDALRGDIMVPSKVYEAAHTEEIEAQHQQAVADVQMGMAQEPTPPTTAAPDLPHVEFVWVPDTLYPPDGLAARFQSASPPPTDADQANLFHTVLRLVQVIERVLSALFQWIERIEFHQDDVARRTTARLSTLSELDEARRQRGRVEQRMRAWEEAHPWRAKLGAVPKELVELADEVARYDRQAQELKATLGIHQNHLADLADDEAKLTAGHHQETQRLGRAVKTLAGINPDHFRQLVEVAGDQERGWLEAVAPVLPEKTSEAVPDAMEEKLKTMALELRPAGPRP